MKKELNLFLLLLFLSYISSTQPKFYAGENQAIKFEIGSTVEYDMDRNYFQFDYSGPTGVIIQFTILNFSPKFNITFPNGDKIKLRKIYGYSSNCIRYEAELNYEGTYYINIECDNVDCITGGNFNSAILREVIDTIDFTKNYYINEMDFRIYGNKSINTYKIPKLSEEKYVYFSMLRNEYSYYYPYYPDEPDPYASHQGYEPELHRNSTIFEVCNDETNKCQRKIRLYHFEKNTEYTIKIHYLTFYYRSHLDFISPQYIFFPITQENFKQITSDYSGNFLLDRPTFYIANKNFESQKYINGNEINSGLIFFYSTKANDNLNYNNVMMLSDLIFEKKGQIHIKQKQDYCQINLILSSKFDSLTKIFLIDGLLYNQQTYNIPANSAVFIHHYEVEEEEKVENIIFQL